MPRSEALPAAPGHAVLEPYLRLLWNIAPPIHAPAPGADADTAPFLTEQGLHLPSPPTGLEGADACAWQRAAAAHAAAHLVFSRRLFARVGVAPVTQALVDVLEDARVEALARRALPGLRALWTRWHTASPADGQGFAALLARLARALADPGYDDPHPWVRKGRALFFLDAAGDVVSPAQGLALRRMASALGHDLGQMRMAFDPRTHRIVPSYRDDNRWLWLAPEQEQAARPPGLSPSPQDEAAPDAALVPPERVYPEWDARIGRLRASWCEVRERLPSPAPARAAAAQPAGLQASLLAALRRLARAPSRRAGLRSLDGEGIDLDAAIEAAAARRHRLPFDPRVHRRPITTPERGAAFLLIDTSASSEASLPLALAAAEALAQALGDAGWCVMVQGFESQGRRAVTLWRVLDAGERWNDHARGRLHALRAAHSTRLGAALRHATGLLAAWPASRRVLWLLGDADAHDIDIHEPGYLAADARHAVQAARRQGIGMRALVCADDDGSAAARIFGPGGWARVRSLQELPQVLGGPG
ncbi:hypothetical protein DBA29_07610 [Xenophilus aerolatus]|nr:hypothetical protein [Xenophilus aerolatus]